MAVGISRDFTRWLLANYVALEAIAGVPQTKGDAERAARLRRRTTSGGGQTRTVSIRRSSLVQVLEAAGKAVRVMSPGLRQVFRLRFRQGWRRQRVASKLGISQATLTRRLNKGFELVEAVLQQLDSDVLMEFNGFFSEADLD
jgi:DNA-directed RNA polymerase specialized sigma24 family protein